MTTLLICLAIGGFWSVVSLLDWLIDKTQEARMARQWSARERWRDPSSTPRRRHTRRVRRWRV